jgi:CP family cyanate transporter-like MFS transporter
LDAVRRTSLLLGLFFCALALRPQVVGIGPLLPRIEHNLGISHAVAGLLATIPVLCMGVFAPLGGYLAHAFGTRWGLALSVGLVAGAGIGRALVPGSVGVLLITVPIGIGIAAAGALLPIGVKERLADRPAFSTGIYAMGINLGTALASALAVPLARGLGGWRESLLVFSGASALLAPAWLMLSRREEPHSRPEAKPPRVPWRSGVAWRLALAFGVMGIAFYGMNAWLPDAYVEHGWSESSAGALLGVFNIAALPGTVLIPWLSDHLGARHRFLTAFGACFAGGALGLTLFPGAAWFFAVLGGIGVSALLPLVMTLPLDAADEPGDVGALVGLMLGAGYTMAAVAPFALGAVRDASGHFAPVLWIIFGLTALLVVLLSRMTPRRLRAAPLPSPL